MMTNLQNFIQTVSSMQLSDYLDILVVAFGAMIGWGVFYLYNRLRVLLHKKSILSSVENPYSRDIYARYFAIYIFILFAILLLLSFFKHQYYIFL